MSPDEILVLARAYAAAEECSLSSVGVRAANNNKVFNRILDGKGVNTKTLLALESFLRTHWPAGAPWPQEIANPPGRMTRRRRNKPMDATAA